MKATRVGWIILLPAGTLLITVLLSSLVSSAGRIQFAFELPTGSQQVSQPLELGTVVEKKISRGQVHSFTIEAKANQYLHVLVYQRGIDVLVTLFGPDGTRIMEEDRTDAFGPEMLGGILPPPGQYRIELRPVEENANEGRYEISIRELREAREDDRAFLTAMAEAFDAVDNGNEVAKKGDPASLNSAVKLYNKALPILRRLGDRYWEASTLNDLGMALHLLGEKQKAIDIFKQSLPIFQSLGVRSTQAAVLDNLAIAHNSIDAIPSERKLALDYYNQELVILREIGDRRSEVNTLNNIGLIHNFLGKHQTSLEFFSQALPLSKSLSDRTGEANSLYNTGRAYDVLSERQKALEYYEEALPIFRGLGNRMGESRTLHNMGSTYHALGQMQKALEFYNQSLAIDRATEDKLGEGTTLNDIGGVYSDLGDKQKALEFYNQALLRRRANGDRSGEAGSLNNIGAVYDTLGQRQQAFEFYNQALNICRTYGDRDGEATTLNNIGYLYSDLGEKEKALEFYQQALEIHRSIGNRSGEATALNNLGRAYDELGERRKAAELFMQARLLHRDVGDRGGEAVTLNNMGGIFEDLGEKEKALDFLNQALSLYETIGDDHGIANTLTGIGAIYSDLGQREKALASYNKAMVLWRVVGDRGGEAITLGNLAAESKESGKPSLAIFYGKQTINIYQILRSNIQSLNKEHQKTYLGKVEPSYRFVADLLISEGRLAEAQQTLNLFKDQQFFDFNRDTQKVASPLTLTPRESTFLALYEQSVNHLGKVAQQVRDLELMVGRREANTKEASQLHELEQQVKSAAGGFQSLLKRIETEFQRPDSDKDKIQELADTRELQTALRELKAQTKHVPVAVYTLIGEDNLRLLVVTPDKIFSASQPIKAETLNENALALWALLQSDKYDPVPLAQELYKAIFKPIEAQLPKDTSTILWSLDGSLRYVPMAALHDGKQYLIERYSHVVFTRADRERLLRDVSPSWTGLGLGSSQAHVVDLLGDKIAFNALPGVTEELGILFRQTGRTTGLLEGEVLPDARFTKATMLNALKVRRPLVHISSHFNFRPGDEARSFLLLGDGTALTLEEMKQYLELFAGVELLTLSACNTAAQQSGANGREIDGFAELAQRLGAGSVMATLWPVADNSTPWLMREFYETRQNGNGLTKAEAVRSAQLALLNGTARTKPLPEGEKGASSSVQIVVTQNGGKRDSLGTRAKVVYVSERNAPAFKQDDKRPFAHPYYWAPFILIGNWK